MTTDSHMDPIDERLRAAMKALDDQVSDRYFEELPNKVLARSEEKQMQSDVNRRTGSANPPLTVAPKAQDDDSTQQTRKVERQEDSGLHDMRALAQTTKQRMSQRRVPTQNPPIDDAALRASHASLRAIALPDPDKMVSVDEPVTIGSGTGPAPALLDRATSSSTAAPATATARAAITPIKQRSKAPLVVASSVVALAAAGVVGYVVLNKNKSTQDSKTSAAAMEDRAAAGSMTVTPTTTPVEEAPKAPAPAAAFSATGGAAPGGDVAAAAGAINGVGGAADEADDPAKTTTDGDAKDQNTTKSDRADKHGAGSGKSDEKKKKDDKGNKDSSGGKSGAGDAGSDGAKDDATPVSNNDTKKGPADKQEQSLDDLLRSAGVDPNAPKKTEGPKLDKKGLDAGDIRKAMSARTSKAQACYAKYSVSGSVGVKLQVANDGTVKSAKATGSFAGTPTGDCVADAASAAKFPAWDGNPTTVEYSYFLSE